MARPKKFHNRRSQLATVIDAGLHNAVRKLSVDTGIPLAQLVEMALRLRLEAAGKLMENTMPTRSAAVAPTPNGAGVSKREKFNWKPLDAEGELQWVDKAKLYVDHTYQRDVQGQQKVNKIASAWSWPLCGVIIVNRRADGTWAVIDGQHRVLAALKRDDIPELPCIVFALPGIKEEAAAFQGANTMKSAMKATDNHRASVVAENPVAQKVNSLLVAHGYSVTPASNVPHTTKAVATITKAVKDNPMLAEKALAAAVDVCAGEALTQQLFRGLYSAAKKDPRVLEAQYTRRFKEMGQAVICNEIKRHKALTGLGGEAVEAAAILKLANKGRRVNLLG